MHACKSRAFPANSSYSMDASATEPHCHCDCQLGKSLASFCDRLWKAEKMVNSSPDMNKITTLADGLSGTVHSLDLRKLNSNLHRIQSQMKALEQGLKTDPGIDTLLLKKSLASLHQHSDVLRGYTDTMKALAKEVFKLNLLLKQSGVHAPQKPIKRQSGSQVKGHPMVDGVTTGATVLATMGNGPETFTTPVNATLPSTHPEARKNKSSIYVTKTPGGEKEGTEQKDYTSFTEIPMTPTNAVPWNEQTTPPTPPARGENTSSTYEIGSPHKADDDGKRPNNVRKDECSGTLLAIDPPVSRGVLIGKWLVLG
ncbi:olfactomedin-like protein 2A [Pleurodeles waltl]|uniref:olfactomedin-like protein 2A n=1 Tax=Pleurodeles waltl TaxID=8319 RepID=UPI003709B3A5